MARNLKETIDKTFYRKLGNMIHDERKKRDLSLRELAEITGLSRYTIDKYELGRSRIDPIRWSKLCEALQISDKIYVKIALGLREYE